LVAALPRYGILEMMAWQDESLRWAGKLYSIAFTSITAVHNGGNGIFPCTVSKLPKD
jgi:hypothetical protein